MPLEWEDFSPLEGKFCLVSPKLHEICPLLRNIANKLFKLLKIAQQVPSWYGDIVLLFSKNVVWFHWKDLEYTHY